MTMKEAFRIVMRCVLSLLALLAVGGCVSGINSDDPRRRAEAFEELEDMPTIYEIAKGNHKASGQFAMAALRKIAHTNQVAFCEIALDARDDRVRRMALEYLTDTSLVTMIERFDAASCPDLAMLAFLRIRDEGLQSETSDRLSPDGVFPWRYQAALADLLLEEPQNRRFRRVSAYLLLDEDLLLKVIRNGSSDLGLWALSLANPQAKKLFRQVALTAQDKTVKCAAIERLDSSNSADRACLQKLLDENKDEVIQRAVLARLDRLTVQERMEAKLRQLGESQAKLLRDYVRLRRDNDLGERMFTLTGYVESMDAKAVCLRLPRKDGSELVCFKRSSAVPLKASDVGTVISVRGKCAGRQADYWLLTDVVLVRRENVRWENVNKQF